MPEKRKPHEDPHCVCDPCSEWILDQMDLQSRTTAEQRAEEDKHLFEVLDRIAGKPSSRPPMKLSPPENLNDLP